MKVMTTNFVQCVVKDCAKTGNAFPLQYSDVTLVRQEAEFEPEFIANVLPKLDWDALVQTAKELGNPNLPQDKPIIEDAESPEYTQLLKDLHELLVETIITEGSMTCRNCGHIYKIMNSIPNFLLPPHLAN
ncbi:multifunctional methyltransferase subunit Trm112p [Trichomonascus vanleenenianus]|uniref:RNA methylation protein TRM112 n=1 Tax=Trichomonascus vanleenenianus TaxID=2268995 RepID=UPI003ECA2C1C